MRLIDADALKEMLIKERDAISLTKTERYGFGVEFPDPHGMSMRGGINKAFRCMEQTPTIDAVPVVRWIPVTERLPKPNELVLCIWKRMDAGYYGFARYQHDDVWYVSNEGMPKVTHWMPLPEPPMRKGENG